jgi:LSD1 subclass zinc finger protein
MQLRCPGCRSSLSIPEGLAGRTVRCQFCDETFRPADVDGEVPTLEPAEPMRTRVRSASLPTSMPQPAPTRRLTRTRTASRRRPIALWLLIPFGLIAALGVLLTIGALILFVFDGGAKGGGLGPAAQAADGTLSAETVAHLKAMTVFVKVKAGDIEGSGSGFLIKVDGNTGYVVTNNHVANPSDDDDGPGMPRIRPRFRGAKPRLTAVLNSGTANERSVRAEQFIADAERDLAILRIEAKDLPQPLDLTDHAHLTETMPVYIVGYPFGEELGLNRNPAVNVGKATVTSIRRDHVNKPAMVQFEGEIHPGNSGGPVVDSQGRLIGIAVMKLRGTRIGFAIAPTVLEDMLRRGR